MLFTGWSKFETIWLLTFSALAVVLTLLWHDTLFGFSVFFSGIVCVVLTARGSIWNYAWGTYNSIGYAWLAFKNGLYGEVALNAGYFLPMQLVGFLLWKTRMREEARGGRVVEMRRQTRKQLVFWLLATAAITLLGGWALSLIPSENTPYMDASTNVMSVIAMVLMAKRYAEQWLYWILIDIVSVGMWSYRLGTGVEGSTTMVIMWLAFLVNAIYGYSKWLRGSRKVTADV